MGVWDSGGCVGLGWACGAGLIGRTLVPEITASATYRVARMSDRRIPLVASAMALTAGAVWSFGAIIARLADGSDAFQYLIWRSIGIIIVVELIARFRGKPVQVVRAYTSGRLMLTANVMLLIASLGFVYAVKTTTAANAAFFGSTTPVFGALVARVVLRERLDRVTITSVLVAFVGLFVMVAGNLSGGNMVGNLAALSAALGFAGYTVCVRSDPDEDWSPVLPGYGVMMIAICGLVVVSHGDPLVPPASDLWWAVLHGGVFIVVGTFLYNIASRRVPAAAMTVFAQTEMVLVPVWAYLVLSEVPKTTTVIGGLIIVSAIVGKAIVDARSRDREPVVVMEPL
jgi:drug/metabolite transporter, DME family